MARSSLDDFIVQVGAALDRGMRITAEDVLAGLAYALALKRDKDPIKFELAVQHIEDRVRMRRVPTKRELAEREQQIPLALGDIDYTYRGPVTREWPSTREKPYGQPVNDEDRRFGQPHYGHPPEEEPQK